MALASEGIVAVLLEHGANINDAGGPFCEGVTPLHDALSCGNFKVAQILVERGASVTLRNSKVRGARHSSSWTSVFYRRLHPQGYTALDTLHQWQRTYSRELDQEARQDCVATERLLRKALAGGGEDLGGVVMAVQPRSSSFHRRFYVSSNSGCRPGSCQAVRRSSGQPAVRR